MSEHDVFVEKLVTRAAMGGILGLTLMNACQANENSKRAYTTAQAARQDIAELEKRLASQQPRRTRSVLFERNADILGGPSRDTFAFNLDGTITVYDVDGNAPLSYPAYTHNVIGGPQADVYEICPDGTLTILEIDGKRPGEYDPKKVSQYARPPLPFRIMQADTTTR